MGIGVLLTGVLIFKYGKRLNLRPSYDIYDAVNTAPARWLLPKRAADFPNTTTLHNLRDALNQTEVPTAGGPGRWVLPPDYSEIREYAGVVTVLDEMAVVLGAVLLLQSLTIVLLIFR